MYCGNNRKYTGLTQGTHTLGTRYKCFRRGVGIGRNLPVTNNSIEYEPIDRRKNLLW